MTISLHAFLVSALAPLCVYLASDQQRIIDAPLHKAWRAIGLVLAIAGACIWSTIVSSNAAAIFASLTVWISAYVVLPYISWVRHPQGDES